MQSGFTASEIVKQYMFRQFLWKSRADIEPIYRKKKHGRTIFMDKTNTSGEKCRNAFQKKIQYIQQSENGIKDIIVKRQMMCYNFKRATVLQGALTSF